MWSVAERLLPCLFLLLPACTWNMALPKGFAELSDTGGFDAVTADGARLHAREFGVGQTAGLEFWAACLEHDLIAQRGYTLIGEGDVTDGDGHAGHWFDCVVNHRGERYGYLVAVFVYEKGWLNRHDVVRVAEFAAPLALYEPHKPEVLKALATLRD